MIWLQYPDFPAGQSQVPLITLPESYFKITAIFLISLFMLALHLALMAKFIDFFMCIKSLIKYISFMNFFPLSIVLITAFLFSTLHPIFFDLFHCKKRHPRQIFTPFFFSFTFCSKNAYFFLRIVQNSNVKSASVAISKSLDQCYVYLQT